MLQRTGLKHTRPTVNRFVCPFAFLSSRGPELTPKVLFYTRLLASGGRHIPRASRSQGSSPKQGANNTAAQAACKLSKLPKCGRARKPNKFPDIGGIWGRTLEPILLKYVEFDFCTLALWQVRAQVCRSFKVVYIYIVFLFWVSPAPAPPTQTTRGAT